jgi:hypothetical protein
MIKKLPDILYPGMTMVYSTPTRALKAGSLFTVKKPLPGNRYEIEGGDGHYYGNNYSFTYNAINGQFVLLNEPWETKLSRLIAITHQMKNLYGEGFTEEFNKLLIQLEI